MEWRGEAVERLKRTGLSGMVEGLFWMFGLWATMWCRFGLFSYIILSFGDL